jgi:type II secretory pathway pseudopilin PulG
MPVISKRSEHGFTLIELMISLACAMFVLTIILQLMTQSSRLFVRTKNRADQQIERTLVSEQLNYYRQRWGKGVLTGGSQDGGYPLKGSKFQKDIKVGKLTNSSGTEINHTHFDSLTFFANLEGYAVVNQVIGNKVNLMSCRLRSATGNQTSSCYSVLRGDKPWQPDDLASQLTGGHVSTPLPALLIEPQRTFYTHISGLDSIPDTPECIDQSSYQPNLEANKLVEFKKGNGSALTTTANKELQEGDFIQPIPQKIRLFVKQNSQDKNQPWLYSESQPIVSCSGINNELAPITPIVSFHVEDDPSKQRLKLKLKLGYAQTVERNQTRSNLPLELEYYYGS